MARITLRQIEYFRAIAQAGSISAAAEAEHVSRSSLAAGLDELERILGRPLCVRTKASGISLTTFGEEVLEAAEDLLAAADHLERLGQGDTPSGSLTIACFPSLAPTLLARTWAAMTERYPEISLNVVSAPRDEIIEMILNGRVDCGLAYNLQTFPELASAQLYSTELHVILAADHPLAELPTVPATALADQPLILMDAHPAVEDVMAYFDRCGLLPQIKTRSSNFEFVRSLVARGLGYSLFIQRPSSSTSYEGLPLVARPIDPAPNRLLASLAWNPRRKRPAALRLFEEVLRDCVAQANG